MTVQSHTHNRRSKSNMSWFKKNSAQSSPPPGELPTLAIIGIMLAAIIAISVGLRLMVG